MKRLYFSTDIRATPEKVWEVVTGKETYGKWTAPFSENSRAETDWKEGSKVYFKGGNGEDGMVSRIAVSRPPEYLSIHHLGFLMNGKEDFTSDEVKKWEGAEENYTLSRSGDHTKFEVEIDIVEEYVSEFETKWPQALAALKRLSEEA